MPKLETEQPEQSVAAAIQMMAEILRELKTGSKDDRLDVLADGIQTLVNLEKSRPKENPQYPAISALNPLGELAHPRPELKCRMYWVGYRVIKDVLTHEEIAAMNAIKPGVYRVTKANGATIPFTVTATYDAAGKLERMNFQFPCKSEEDHADHMPMLSYLKEAMGELVPNVDRLMRQVLDLQAELATKQAAA